jgi:hypothetical protein
MDDIGLAWACGQCEKRRPDDFSPYTLKLLAWRRLRLAGYSLRPHDLEVDEWEDLGRLEEILARVRERDRMRTMAALLGLKIG